MYRIYLWYVNVKRISYIILDSQILLCYHVVVFHELFSPRIFAVSSYLTFNRLSGYITSGMEAAYELNTLVQDELDEIYTVIDGINTEGAATPAA